MKWDVNLTSVQNENAGSFPVFAEPALDLYQTSTSRISMKVFLCWSTPSHIREIKKKKDQRGLLEFFSFSTINISNAPEFILLRVQDRKAGWSMVCPTILMDFSVIKGTNRFM